MDTAEDMICNLNLPNYPTCIRPPQGKCPTRLQAKKGAYFPEHITVTDKKQHHAKRFYVCMT